MKSVDTKKTLSYMKDIDAKELASVKKIVMKVKLRGRRYVHPLFTDAVLKKFPDKQIQTLEDVATAVLMVKDRVAMEKTSAPLPFAIDDTVWVPGTAWPKSRWDLPGAWYSASVTVVSRASIGVTFDDFEEVVEIPVDVLREYQRDYARHKDTVDAFDAFVDEIYETGRSEVVRDAFIDGLHQVRAEIRPDALQSFDFVYGLYAGRSYDIEEFGRHFNVVFGVATALRNFEYKEFERNAAEVAVVCDILKESMII